LIFLMLDENASFLMSNLLPPNTGVNGTVIWISAGEFEKGKHSPRIKVVVGDQITLESLSQAASITIIGSPKIIGNLPSKITKNAIAFVKLNQTILIKYWENEVSTREMLNSIINIK